ncbi:hypothetical protein JIX56_08985 [Streptomyces sp. CA-210063]|uniref:hypothetical protein n=1 Tax=Streptomyces sp. CA-210063 TaxID=2801029 RepID=UPI00214CAAEE|nr:hypothetical protein [Streptomyces sp. CA-210063]UUU30013.1 hypothetical protein JIX56_08985 [Streptomyces sp. CA-210063]
MALRHTPLVPSDRLASPSSYRQLARRTEDARFRATLDNLIGTQALGTLSRALAREGAVSTTGLLAASQFDDFRQTYDAEMRAGGSRGTLHSYLNIASSTPLLTNPGLWDTVAHPLFVVLIAYALGGPIKMIDMRAKDTYPVDVVARDNTLHLDNSPFIDEYKVVVTWKLGSAKGPSGQGLTYLPRTNRLFRQCFVEADGSVWSDEDACIFPSESRVDEVLTAQAGFIEGPDPLVVHLTDLDAPCHTIFAASRLVHHRYRTSTGAARSAVMASFHRTDDSEEQLGSKEPGHTPLKQFLVTGGSQERFLSAVHHEKPAIEAALDQLSARPDLLVDPRRHSLTGEAFTQWYSRQCAGVTLNNLRTRQMSQKTADRTSPVGRLVQRLQFDLQGPLNMPFFADMREARRKRARIWLREMSPEDIHEVIEAECMASPHIISPAGQEAIHGSTTALRSLLLDLGRLLAPSRAAEASAMPGPADAWAVRSLPSFIRDLTVTASWLGEGDRDSLTTAMAFALLASALSSRRFSLGEEGHHITERLLQGYVALVNDTADTHP